MRKIRLKNGVIIEVPDDATREEIRAYAESALRSSARPRSSGSPGRRSDPAPSDDGNIFGSAWQGIKNIPKGPLQLGLSALQGIAALDVTKDSKPEQALRALQQRLAESGDPRYRDANLANVGMGLGQVAGIVAASRLGGPRAANTLVTMMGAGEQAARIAEYEERTGRNVAAGKELAGLLGGATLGRAEMMGFGAPSRIARGLAKKTLLAPTGRKAAESIAGRAAGRVAGRARSLSREGVASYAMSGLKSGVGEAAQEAGAGFGQSLLGWALYDSNALADAGASALKEAIIGGQVGGIADVMFRLAGAKGRGARVRHQESKIQEAINSESARAWKDLGGGDLARKTFIERVESQETEDREFIRAIEDGTILRGERAKSDKRQREIQSDLEFQGDVQDKMLKEEVDRSALVQKDLELYRTAVEQVKAGNIAPEGVSPEPEVVAAPEQPKRPISEQVNQTAERASRVANREATVEDADYVARSNMSGVPEVSNYDAADVLAKVDEVVDPEALATEEQQVFKAELSQAAEAGARLGPAKVRELVAGATPTNVEANTVTNAVLAFDSLADLGTQVVDPLRQDRTVDKGREELAVKIPDQEVVDIVDAFRKNGATVTEDLAQRALDAKAIGKDLTSFAAETLELDPADASWDSLQDGEQQAVFSRILRSDVQRIQGDSFSSDSQVTPEVGQAILKVVAGGKLEVAARSPVVRPVVTSKWVAAPGSVEEILRSLAETGEATILQEREPNRRVWVQVTDDPDYLDVYDDYADGLLTDIETSRVGDLLDDFGSERNIFPERPVRPNSLISADAELLRVAARATVDAGPDALMDVAGMIGGQPSKMDALVNAASGAVKREDDYWNWTGEAATEKLQQLRDAYTPVRDLLRGRFGDEVTLYRFSDPEFDSSYRDKSTQLFTSAEFAERFGLAGRRLDAVTVPVDDIITAPTKGDYHEFVVDIRNNPEAQTWRPRGDVVSEADLPTAVGDAYVITQEAVSVGRQGFMAALAESSAEVRERFTLAMRSALTDPTGRDRTLGIVERLTQTKLELEVLPGRGLRGGDLNPNEIVVLRTEFDQANEEQVALENRVVEVYMAVNGIIRGQDAQAAARVRPKDDTTGGDSDGWLIGNNSGEEIGALDPIDVDAVLETLGEFGYGATSIDTHGNILVMDFGNEGGAPLRELIDQLAADENLAVEPRRFDSKYMDGTRAFLETIKGNRQPKSLKREIDDMVAILDDNVTGVYATFAAELGLGPESYAGLTARVQELDALGREVTGSLPSGQRGSGLIGVVNAAEKLAKENGRTPVTSKSNPTIVKELSDRMRASVGRFVEGANISDETASDWYKQGALESRLIAQLSLPELRNDADYTLFTTISSILSNGSEVDNELSSAVGVMEQYYRTGVFSLLEVDQRTGEFVDGGKQTFKVERGKKTPRTIASQRSFRGRRAPGLPTAARLTRNDFDSDAAYQEFLELGTAERVPGSVRSLTHEAAFGIVNDMIADLGKSGTAKFLEGTVERRKKGKLQDVPVLQELFGEKIGRYAGDKLGKDAGGEATLDLWMARGYHMLMGKFSRKRNRKGNWVINDEITPVMRKRLNDVFQAVAKEDNVPMSTVQAKFWYAVKWEFRKQKAREKAGAYATLPSAITKALLSPRSPTKTKKKILEVISIQLEMGVPTESLSVEEGWNATGKWNNLRKRKEYKDAKENAAGVASGTAAPVAVTPVAAKRQRKGVYKGIRLGKPGRRSAQINAMAKTLRLDPEQVADYLNRAVARGVIGYTDINKSGVAVAAPGEVLVAPTRKALELERVENKLRREGKARSEARLQRDAKNLANAKQRIEAFKLGARKNLTKMGKSEVGIKISVAADSIYARIEDIYNDPDIIVESKAYRDGPSAEIRNHGAMVLFNLSQMESTFPDGIETDIDTLISDTAFHEGAHLWYLNDDLKLEEQRSLESYGKRQLVPEAVNKGAFDKGLTWRQWTESMYGKTDPNITEETSVRVLDALAKGQIPKAKAAGFMARISKDLMDRAKGIVDAARDSDVLAVMKIYEKVESGELARRSEARDLELKGMSTLQILDRSAPAQYKALKEAAETGTEEDVQAAARSLVRSRAEGPTVSLQRSLVDDLKARREIEQTPKSVTPILNKQALEEGKISAAALNAYFDFNDKSVRPYNFLEGTRYKGAAHSVAINLMAAQPGGHNHGINNQKDFGEAIEYTALDIFRMKLVDKRMPQWFSQKQEMARTGAQKILASASATAAWRMADSALAYLPSQMTVGPIQWVRPEGSKHISDGGIQFGKALKTKGRTVKAFNKIAAPVIDAGESVVQLAQEFLTAHRVKDVYLGREDARAKLRRAKAENSDAVARGEMPPRLADELEILTDSVADWEGHYNAINPMTKTGRSFPLADMNKLIANVAARAKRGDVDSQIVTKFKQEYGDFNWHQIEFLYQTGQITLEKKLTLQDLSYVPFMRDQGWAESQPLVNTKNANSRGKLMIDRALEGGRAPLDKDLFGSIVSNISAVTRDGLWNIATQRTIRDELNLGTAVEITGKEDADTLRSLAESGFSDVAIRVKIEGETKVFRVKDPLLAQSIMMMGFNPIAAIETFYGSIFRKGGTTLGVKNETVVKGLSKITSGPSKLLRELVTRNPVFVTKNILRDSMQAHVTFGGGPLLILKSIRNVFRRGLLQDARARGLGQPIDFIADPAEAGSKAQKLLSRKKIRGWTEGPIPVLTTLWDALGHLSQQSEVATRMAVYDAVMADTNGDSVEALNQSTEIMNYGRRGSSPVFSVLASMAPFINGRIQGLDVMLRTHLASQDAPGLYKEGFENTRAGKLRQAGTVAQRGAYLAFGTFLYWLAVHDDEEYKNAPENLKNDWWLIPVPGSRLGVKIPIPFEIGLLYKVIPEQILRALSESEHDFGDVTDEVKRQVFDTLYLDLRPQAIRPMMDAAMNRNAFSGRDIVPTWMDNTVSASEQYSPSTNKVAKLISDSLDNIPLLRGMDFLTSPMEMEYMLRQYGGTLGSYSIVLADRVVRWEAGDNIVGTSADFGFGAIDRMPMIGDLLYDRESGGGFQEDFYDTLQQMDRMLADMRKMEGRSDRDLQKEEDFKRENAPLFRAKDRVDALEKFMDDYRKKREELLLRRDLSAQGKRRTLHRMEEKRDQMLAEITEIMGEVRQ